MHWPPFLWRVGNSAEIDVSMSEGVHIGTKYNFYQEASVCHRCICSCHMPWVANKRKSSLPTLWGRRIFITRPHGIIRPAILQNGIGSHLGISLHAHTHTYKHYVHKHIHTYTCIQVHVHLRSQFHLILRVHIHVGVRIHIHMTIPTPVHTHTCTYTPCYMLHVGSKIPLYILHITCCSLIAYEVLHSTNSILHITCYKFMYAFLHVHMYM